MNDKDEARSKHHGNDGGGRRAARKASRAGNPQSPPGTHLDRKDGITEDEVAFFLAIAGEGDGSESLADELPADSETRELARKMAVALLEDGCDAFNDMFAAHYEDLAEACSSSRSLSRFIVIGFKMCIGAQHGDSANNLGALYYRGAIVEQDYVHAARLYEQAMDWGCYSSIVNLGYIYEYGRIGKPDHDRAYHYYALAAALCTDYESLYKLGDMYSRGKAVPRDLRIACTLWQRSYDVAENIRQSAQPAIRLAELYLTPAYAGVGVKADPLKALMLYQQAEVGMRIAISAGETYYSKRLEEALEGQERARSLIGMPLI